ncbi:MAG: NADH-quinone oxidoreductase subunit K [Thioalkalispiraceae bacterium]|jgi:multicomponent Na+:H+ antiporter subunit C
MLIDQLYYGLAGIALFALGVGFTFVSQQLLRRVLAVNIAGAGLFLVLITVGYRGIAQAADPLPHALVLTGIVVAFSATALAIALLRELSRASGKRE